jgi:signal transduction histidine kinase
MSAHDLLTPIRNVRTLTNMLLEDFEDHGDGKLQIIQNLEKVSAVVITLIGDVLTHAEATGATESVENFELAGLTNDIRAMLDPESRNSVQVDEAVIHGDRTATQIILRNLIDNAFKHNRDRVVTLHVSAVKLYEGFYEIAVQDDGVGIDENTLRFLNGGEHRSGNGFGLLGIRKLIRTRGGALSAEMPTSGKGAVVRFALPGQLLAG